MVLVPIAFHTSIVFLPLILFAMMFSILALVLLYTEALAQDNEECIDKSPYCSPNDCAVRPGYALQYCRKTCSNCQPFCYNSHFVSCEDSRKPECDSMLKDYCPLLCGVCRANKKFDRKTRKKGKEPSNLSFSTLKALPGLSRTTNSWNGQYLPSNALLTSTSRPEFSILPSTIQTSQYLSPTGAHPWTVFPPNLLQIPHSDMSQSPAALAGLIALLGCRDKDASCSEITVDTCLSRPGYYMKHCPVKCKNCNGLQCLDSIKIDCAHVRRLGGCKLPLAADYCPRSCSLCSTPLMLADSLPPCKDELDTCEHLAQGGVCEQPYRFAVILVWYS
ncbi:unnamed protein product [Nippostrongylus brasiliensis]|uniref:ShKT domain-containing protein n=1 Tax=Nippostrongylus brasiliensis TaxID=27835 RepID=A0A158R1X6_NIPBR|nr:unnamed protein product [Nippostrongylus brasiliensis]